MSDPAITLLKHLVAIDSVNPSLVPGAAGEAQIADALAAHMRSLGFDVEFQEVTAGRRNVIGVLDGGEPGRTLMFCGHMDTVGVEGMAAPFDPVEREGRIYGRGSQDMKGGIAAMIDAARLARDRGFRKGRLLLAAVVDEEYASLGADRLVTSWTADAAVVTEPTDLHLGVGHKGFTWLEIETRGVAAHGSRPKDGRDAIMRMGRVLTRLERLDRELQSRPAHPVMATPSLHASTIEGGREWSMFPDFARLRIERRTIAGETDLMALAEVESILEALRGGEPEFEGAARLVFGRPAYAIHEGHELTVALDQAATRVGLKAERTGMSFWTDAAILGSAGIPSVLFGPGGAGLHSVEEYVHTADVTACRDALAELALAWGG